MESFFKQICWYSRTSLLPAAGFKDVTTDKIRIEV